MKDVIKLLNTIEKDLARIKKLVSKEDIKAVVKKLDAKRKGNSKSEKIKAWLAKGKDATFIANKLGVAKSLVYTIKSQEKRKAAV